MYIYICNMYIDIYAYLSLHIYIYIYMCIRTGSLGLPPAAHGQDGPLPARHAGQDIDNYSALAPKAWSK